MAKTKDNDGLAGVREQCQEIQSLLLLMLRSQQFCLCVGKLNRACKRHNPHAFRRYLGTEGIVLKRKPSSIEGSATNNGS